MVYVYVLKSLSSEINYVGMAKDVIERLKEHNAGKSKFTKGHRPWELIYSEGVANYSIGRKREKYLKGSSGRRWLKKYLDETARRGFPYGLQTYLGCRIFCNPFFMSITEVHLNSTPKDKSSAL